MSEDLDFAALHSDDALLDALGGRVAGATLGVAHGVAPSASADVVARLLGAFAVEIDTRPGPLTRLLATDTALTANQPAPMDPVLATIGRSDRGLAAVPAADGTTWGDAVPPAVTVGRRWRGRVVAHRAVALGAAGALVLGLGGVAAAVTGKGGPFEDLRRAVSSVTHSSTPHRTPADRATKLLEGAESAMNNGDLKAADDRLSQAERLLPLISELDVARTIRADLDALRQRWAALVPAPAGAASKPATHPSPAGVPGPKHGGATATPGSPSATPTADSLVPGANVGDPTKDLTTVNDSPVGAAKDNLKSKTKKAREKLGKSLPQQAPTLPDHQLPDQPLPGGLPGPVGGLRGPVSSEMARAVGGWTLLYNFGGTALAQPDPAAATRSLTGGAHH